MNMACVRFGLTPEEALAGATLHAARALGRQDRIGTVEAGKQADLVLWNTASPDELAYTIGYNPGAAVIKKGRVLSATETALPSPLT
jgi:imidazolonepropionase